MTTWDERFRSGDYPRDPDPSPVLRRAVEDLPGGRALDVATGTGRNAVFLADEGYEVDAVDRSREGLRIARENAVDRGVADRFNPIRADVDDYAFPTGRYELITVSFYRAVDRFPDLKEALVPGGSLFVEHHLRTDDPAAAAPSSDRYRFAANELLNACLDLTVVYFDQAVEERPDGKRRPSTRILARKSSGTSQSYPPRLFE